MTDQPSLLARLERIRRHLDKLATTPLSDDDLAHLAAIDEWLSDQTDGAGDA